jgi:hypothetical protein
MFGPGRTTTMKTSLRNCYRRLWLAVRVTVGVVAFYIFTIGLIPAIFRHTEDGRLQWLRSVPGALTTLAIYERPARCLGRVPGIRVLFELSADFWCGITGAPETTA